MKTSTPSLLIALGYFLFFSSCHSKHQKQVGFTGNAVVAANSTKDNCNWCGTSEAPENVSWKTIIAPKGEPGEKLIVSGTVYLPDGTTPAKDIIIYVHHTNAEGIYPKTGNEKGNGKYHGYLRGWMKTNSFGRYEFETVRPAAYETHTGEPAHIHYNVEGPGYPEYWLTALWFDDDPRVDAEQLKNVKRNGGFTNVTSLTKDENGDLRGVRNIILQTFEE